MPSTENITVAIWGGMPTNLRSITNHIGDLPSTYKPRMYKLVKEPKMWLIAHTKDLTLYSAVSSEALSGGSGEVLRVDIMVPANRRIAGGKSPLDLLNKMMECAEKNAIQGGVLTTQTIDNLPFLYHLKEFHLEERPSALPVMIGSNAGSLCIESTRQLDALMRFSKYPILANISQLELGFKCPTTIKIDTKSGGRPAPQPPTGTGTGTGAGVKTPPVKGKEIPHKSNPLEKPLTSKTDPPKKKGSKAGLIAAVIAGVLVLGIGLIALLGGNSNKPNEYAYTDTNYALPEQPTPSTPPSNDEVARPTNPTTDRVSDSPASDRKTPAGATSQPNQPSKPAQQRPEPSATTQPSRPGTQQNPPSYPSQQQQPKPRPSQPATPTVDNSWKAGVQTLKNKCPYLVRNTTGTTEVTDIIISDTRVTVSVKFYDVSMYDLSQSTKTTIQNIRIPAVRADFNNLPSHVKVNIVCYDKAGRQLSL